MIFILTVVLLLPPAPCPEDAVCFVVKAKLLCLSYIYKTVPEQFNPNIRVCAAHFIDDCFLNLAE